MLFIVHTPHFVRKCVHVDIKIWLTYRFAKPNSYIRLGLCVHEYVILRVTCQSECQYKFVCVITGSGTVCGDAE